MRKIGPGDRVHLSVPTVAGNRGPGTVVEVLGDGTGACDRVTLRLDGAEGGGVSVCLRREVRIIHPRPGPALRLGRWAGRRGPGASAAGVTPAYRWAMLERAIFGPRPVVRVGGKRRKRVYQCGTGIVVD